MRSDEDDQGKMYKICNGSADRANIRLDVGRSAIQNALYSHFEVSLLADWESILQEGCVVESIPHPESRARYLQRPHMQLTKLYYHKQQPHFHYFHSHRQHG